MSGAALGCVLAGIGMVAFTMFGPGADAWLPLGVMFVGVGFLISVGVVFVNSGALQILPGVPPVRPAIPAASACGYLGIGLCVLFAVAAGYLLLQLSGLA